MNKFKEFDELLKRYKTLNIEASKQEFDKLKINFIFHSNRLEGSNLTLAQTEELINHHTLKGEGSLEHMLMAIDNYKALNQALMFGANKYPLSERLILQLHKILLKNTFEIDPFYNSWKTDGQKLGEFKIKSNRIKITNFNEDVYYSTPEPSKSIELIRESIEIYNISKNHFIDKLSNLVQNIYNAHAFFDGNKRMTRLIIGNQLIANKLPLMVGHNHENKYNDALVEGFINGGSDNIKEVLNISFCQHLSKEIELTKKMKKPKGFGMIL